MLEMKRTVVCFEESDRVKLEEIIALADKKAALVFARKSLYERLILVQRK